VNFGQTIPYNTDHCQETRLVARAGLMFTETECGASGYPVQGQVSVANAASPWRSATLCRQVSRWRAETRPYWSCAGARI